MMTARGIGSCIGRDVGDVHVITGCRRGVTLIELLVVLMILGLMAGIVGLSFTRDEPAPDAGTLAAAHDTIAAARRSAIAGGMPVAITVLVNRAGEHDAGPQTYRATALPDGSVIADAALGIDRLSGRPITAGPRVAGSRSP